MPGPARVIVCIRRRAAAAAACGWLGFVGAATPSSAQSLGEVAAREAERRAAIAVPSPLYTNVPQPERMPGHEPMTAAPAASRPSAVPHSVTSVAPFPLASLAASAPMPSPPPRPVTSPPRTEAAATPVAAAPARTPFDSDWAPFRLEKTEAEIAETARLAGLGRRTAAYGAADVVLPPQRDVMRMSTGLGYVAGADWALDVTGAGRVHGLQTEASAFFTAGTLGVRPRSGRLSVFSPEGGWRAEGGDLYSDLRGLARGARLSWDVAGRWMPGVSIYSSRSPGGWHEPAIAYRDRFEIVRGLRLGGELSSDGSAFVQVQYAREGASIGVFQRTLGDGPGGRDRGVSGSLQVWRGVRFSGALRRSEIDGDPGRWQLASVRFPLGGSTSVAIERSWWDESTRIGAVNAVTLQTAIGPVRIAQRIQWGHTDYPMRAVPLGFGHRGIRGNAWYTPGPWGRLHYQQASQWLDDGRVQHWDELASTFQLGARTTARLVSAFPDVDDPRRLRVSLTRRLAPTLELEFMYGRLSAFQNVPGLQTEQSRAMVTLRKAWDLESPARGGTVTGRSIDEFGQPVAGALVRLGPYATVTDEDGRYSFTRVPDGEFALELDSARLPASYGQPPEAVPLQVSRGSRADVDLLVAPLGTIRGHVFIDRNGNGRLDDGEGVARVAVSLGEFATATDSDGSFAFYNRRPGRHVVSLRANRLPDALAPASPVDLDVELAAGGELDGLLFRVAPRERPILMRELP